MQHNLKTIQRFVLTGLIFSLFFMSFVIADDVLYNDPTLPISNPSQAISNIYQNITSVIIDPNSTSFNWNFTINGSLFLEGFSFQKLNQNHYFICYNCFWNVTAVEYQYLSNGYAMFEDYAYGIRQTYMSNASNTLGYGAKMGYHYIMSTNYNGISSQRNVTSADGIFAKRGIFENNITINGRQVCDASGNCQSTMRNIFDQVTNKTSNVTFYNATFGNTTQKNIVAIDPMSPKILEVHGNLNFVSIPQPPSTFNLTLSGNASSNANRQTWYRIRYVTADGKTYSSSDFSKNIVVTGNQSVMITNIPQPTDPRVTGIEILKNNAVYWNWDYYFQILTTLTLGTTTYTDTSGDAAWGTDVELSVLDNSLTSAQIFQDNIIKMFIGRSTAAVGTGVGIKGTLNTHFGYNTAAGGTEQSLQNAYFGAEVAPVATNARNVGVGAAALNDLTTGNAETAVGYGAGQFLTTGYWNTFIGYRTGEKTTSGVGNVDLGVQAGFDESALGGAGVSANTDYSTTIGAFAQRTHNRVITLGNNMTSYYPKVAIGTTNPDSHLEVRNIQDEVGISVRGYATQNNNLYQGKLNNGTIIFAVNGSGTVFGKGYVTWSDVYDEKKEGKALDKLKSSSELLREDGSINHKEFGYSYLSYSEQQIIGYKQINVTREIYADICSNESCKKKKELVNMTIDEPIYINVTREGVDMVKEVAQLREAITELRDENNAQEERIIELERIVLGTSGTFDKELKNAKWWEFWK